MRHKEGTMLTGVRRLAARAVREESGQTIILYAVMMVFLLAMAGFVIDVGRAMVIQKKLKASTIAAALAGATEMPNSDFATVAQDYSSIHQYNAATNSYTTGRNTTSDLPGVQTQVSGYCSNFVSATLGISCVQIGASRVNALVVTQTVTMSTIFMGIVGIRSLSFSSTETAAWKGSARKPYNVAVILDSSGSMNTVDSGSDGCNGMAAFACALSGVQTLLANLTPCAAGSNCDSSSNPLDEVALYTFPGLSSSQAVSDDVNCTAQIMAANHSYPTTGGFGQTDSTVYYGFPGSSFSGSTLLPSPPIYQLVGFSHDYKSTPSTLNGSSQLVKAVGGGGTPNCRYITSGYYYQQYGGRHAGTWGGIQAAGGADTYYAGVIYQAQSDLYSQYQSRRNANLQTDNVMVILSDGNAQTSAQDLGGPQTTTTTQNVCTGGYNWWGQCQGWTPQPVTSTKLTANSNGSGAYPSYNNECQQAVTAAQAATRGTWPTSQSSSSPVKTTVYTVAYGAEVSGCSEMPPCTTMKQMASSYLNNPGNQDLNFYSDYLNTATGGADRTCTSSNGITNIPKIFQSIAASLSSSKIMQNPAGCTAGDTSTCN